MISYCLVRSRKHALYRLTWVLIKSELYYIKNIIHHLVGYIMNCRQQYTLPVLTKAILDIACLDKQYYHGTCSLASLWVSSVMLVGK